MKNKYWELITLVGQNIWEVGKGGEVLLLFMKTYILFILV
jgi:hypothetical protein